MRLLLKDQIRKIKQNLFNFISLTLLVMVISLTFTASKQSVLRLEENYEPYLEAQNGQDFHFSLDSVDIQLLGGTELVYLCEELDIEYQCYYNISLGTNAAWNNLNHIVNVEINRQPDVVADFVDSYIDQVEEDYNLVIEKKLYSDIIDGNFSYRFTNVTSSIDLPYLVEGKLPDQDYEITLFPEFAESNDIHIGDTYTINSIEYTIVGFTYAPDYVFPIYYMNPMDTNTETIIYTTYNTVDSLTNYKEQRYVGTGSLDELFDETTFKEINETDTSVFGKTSQIKHVRPSASNFAIMTLPLETKNAHTFINVFITVFILFLSLLILIFLKRNIQKNKQDIDVLQKLGFSNKELTLSMMVFPFLVSISSILGFLLGLLLSNPLFNIYSARYLFPKADFSIYGITVLVGVILPIIIINLVSYIFIYQSLQHTKPKPQKLKWKIYKFVPFKTSISTGIILLSLSIMLLIGLNGNTMFEAFAEETSIGNDYHEALLLDYYTNAPLRDYYEPYTLQRGKITTINDQELSKNYGIRVYGIRPTNELKVLIDDDPTYNLLLEDGAIISEYASYNLSLSTGDIITLQIDGEDIDFTIKGISNELIENNIFIHIETLNNIYNLDDSYYNGVFTTDDQYYNVNIIQRINYEESLNEIIRLLDASNLLINLILLLSTIISLFVFSLILMNFLSDNKLQIAILKSIGYNNKEINKKYLLHIYILFVVLYIIAIPITRVLFDLLLKTIIEQLGYILIVNISIWNIVIGFLLLNTLFFITIYLVNKYYEKISIGDILKVNIK